MERWYKIVDIAFHEKQQADLGMLNCKRIKLYYCQWFRKWRTQKVQYFPLCPRIRWFCHATFSKLAWLSTWPVAFCSLSHPSQLAECRFHFQNNRTRPAELQIHNQFPGGPASLSTMQPASRRQNLTAYSDYVAYQVKQQYANIRRS